MLFCNYKHVRVNNIMSGGNIKEEKKQEEAGADEFRIPVKAGKPFSTVHYAPAPSPLFPCTPLNSTLAEVTPKRSKPGRQGSLDHPCAQGLRGPYSELWSRVNSSLGLKRRRSIENTCVQIPNRSCALDSRFNL